MSSMHRLIALIVVWVAFALVAVVTMVNSIFLRTEGVITVFTGIVLGALAATWMIRSMKPAASGEKPRSSRAKK